MGQKEGEGDGTEGRREGRDGKGLTPESPLCTAGASMMESTMTKKARNTTYIIRVVMEDLASADLQHKPQAEGPMQQQSRSRHIMAGSVQQVEARGRAKTRMSLC